jgi:hypothetical protein
VTRKFFTERKKKRRVAFGSKFLVAENGAKSCVQLTARWSHRILAGHFS